MITSYYTTKLGLEPETITYRDRVESDGGEVIDLSYVDSVYKKVKELGVLSNLLMFTSHRAGVKKDTNNAVSKLFSMDINANDGVQTTASRQPIFFSDGILYDGIDDVINYGNKTNFDVIDKLTTDSEISPLKYSSRATILTRTQWYYFKLGLDKKIQAFTYGTSNQGYHVSINTIPLNQFTRVGYTYNGSNLIFYINENQSGIIANTGSLSQNIGQYLPILGVGAEILSSSNDFRYLNAKVKYNRLWNTALSQQQITELNAL